MENNEMNATTGNIYLIHDGYNARPAVICNIQDDLFTAHIFLTNSRIKNTIPYILNGCQNYISKTPIYIKQDRLIKYLGKISDDVLIEFNKN